MGGSLFNERRCKALGRAFKDADALANSSFQQLRLQ